MKDRFAEIAGLLLLVCTLSAHGAEPVGMVVALQGNAVATTPAGDSRELAMASDIFLNDSIQTAPASRIQFLLNDDSLIAQGESSEMTIDEFVYNPDVATDNAFGVKLGKGLFRTVTGKITDLNPERFTVKTSRATIGIRGCDLGFKITASEDNISIITVPEGKTIFINPLTGDQSIEVNSPLFVTVNDQGMIQQRELSVSDRTEAQQKTTPGSEAPEPDSTSSDIDLGDIIKNDLTSENRSLLDEGNIIQDAVQSIESGHIH